MRKIIILSLLTALFAGELEVEGNLTVTEGVNASSFVGDGSGLTNLPSLGDMKPERIYSKTVEGGIPGSDFTFTVPSGKFWILYSFGHTGSIYINGSDSIELQKSLCEGLLDDRGNSRCKFVEHDTYVSNKNNDQKYWSGADLRPPEHPPARTPKNALRKT